jgi:hypothetical protein
LTLRNRKSVVIKADVESGKKQKPKAKHSTKAKAEGSRNESEDDDQQEMTRSDPEEDIVVNYLIRFFKEEAGILTETDFKFCDSAEDLQQQVLVHNQLNQSSPNCPEKRALRGGRGQDS